MPNPFAAWGAAEAVTLIAATLGTATAVGITALPKETVAISGVALTIAGGGPFFVGDRITLNLSANISYGDVEESWDDLSTDTALEVRLYEDGATTPFYSLKKHARKSARETVTITVEARAKKHGRAAFRAEVQAWGEDDDAWFSTDSSVSRTQQSNTLVIDIEKPVSIEFTPQSQDVGHGAKARVEAFANNRSELPCRVFYRIAGKSAWHDAPAQSGRESMGYREKRHRDSHPAHTNPMPYYFQDNRLEGALMKIPGRDGAVDKYVQPLQAFGARRVSCTRDPAAPEDTSVGQIDTTVPSKPLPLAEPSFVCIIVEPENGNGVTCGGSAYDGWGSRVQFQTGTDGRASITFPMRGERAWVNVAPEDKSLLTVSQEFFASDLTGEIRIETPLASGPVVRGRIVVSEPPIALEGISITLETETGAVVQRTTSGRDGYFEVQPAVRHLNEGVFVRAALPDRLGWAWTNSRPSAEVDLLTDGTALPIVLVAKVPPAEDMVTISGTVLSRDGITGEPKRIPNLVLRVRDPESADVVAESQSNSEGTYSFEAPMGRWRIETDLSELPEFAQPSHLLADLRSSRNDVPIMLKRPAPRIISVPSAGGTLVGTTGLGSLEAKILALVNGDVISSATTDPSGGFMLETAGWPQGANIRLFTVVNELAGRGSAPLQL